MQTSQLPGNVHVQLRPEQHRPVEIARGPAEQCWNIGPHDPIDDRLPVDDDGDGLAEIELSGREQQCERADAARARLHGVARPLEIDAAGRLAMLEQIVRAGRRSLRARRIECVDDQPAEPVVAIRTLRLP